MNLRLIKYSFLALLFAFFSCDSLEDKKGRFLLKGNEKMEEKPPWGNRPGCTLVSVKIKQDAASHIWHEFYSRKVWTVNIKDVEWLTAELADNSEEITSIKCKLYQLEMNGNEHQNTNNEYLLN